MRQEVAWIVVMAVAAGCSSTEARRDALRRERLSLERTRQEFRNSINTPAGARYHDAWESNPNRERMIQAFQNGENRLGQIDEELKSLEGDGFRIEAALTE